MDNKIAILGWKTGDNSFGVTLPYYAYLQNFGDVHIISPIKYVDFSQYDLLVIPGGPDINPATYGYIPSMFTGASDPIREYYDRYLLPQAIDHGVPILGICRGHQAVAIFFRQTIIQSMYHETNPSKERSKLVHDIEVHTEILPEGLKEEMIKNLSASKKNKGHAIRRSQEVNSMHHQAVKGVPEEAVLLASYYNKSSSDDDTIEALYYPDYNIFTFQYHPEEIWDDLSMSCVRYLLTQKKEKDAKKEERVLDTDISV